MNALLTWVSALLLYAASAPVVAPQDENPFDRGVRLYQQGKYAESIAPLVGICVGAFIPHWLVKRWINKRQEAFVNDLPEALDMIVRGVKSGLPVAETVVVVSEEMEGVIAYEFTRVTEDARIGMTLEAALWASAERLNTPEFKFFVVVLTVQRETGGNLAEALGNLSNVLRSRKLMEAKIKALSAEAKASAYIIGSLPFLVMGAVKMASPDYLDPLFTTQMGNFILIGAGMWMGTGILVMRKMIQIKV